MLSLKAKLNIGFIWKEKISSWRDDVGRTLVMISPFFHFEF